jgi:hypothetical protein
MDSNKKDITSFLTPDFLEKAGLYEINFESMQKKHGVNAINVSSRDIKRLREVLANKEYLENEVFPGISIEFTDKNMRSTYNSQLYQFGF